jgi:flagellar motor switch protein FliM
VKELLTNQEIEALLDMFRAEGAPDASEALDSSKVGSTAQSLSSVVRSVDLLKPNRMSADQMRSLVRSLQSAAKFMSATLSDKLRMDLQCDCVAVEQQRFRTWLKQVAGPAAIYTVKLEPLGQLALFSVSNSLLYSAVDRILGGSGKLAKVPKEFTVAEYTVADHFVGPCLDRICESLAEIIEMSWEIQDRFCNIGMANILPMQDVMLTAYFQVGGEILLGDLRLAIPFASLEPHLESFAKDKGFGLKHPPGTMRDVVAQSMKPVLVEMCVRLGSTSIGLRQLLALQEGDVVPVNTRVGDLLVAPVQGKPKFRGRVGTRGKRLAFQVMELMES